MVYYGNFKSSKYLIANRTNLEKAEVTLYFVSVYVKPVSQVTSESIHITMTTA